MFDVESIRKEFPILHRFVHGKPLAYLDNAATTQKPIAVLNAINTYYRENNANIHRGVHHLSELATFEYEKARGKVKNFLNASDSKEIIFTRGATEGINLVAQSYGRKNFKEGDEIIISAMEHHSNIVPWQMVCEVTGAKLKVIPIDDNGELLFDEFVKLVNEKIKFVSVVYVSNSLGTINPVKQIIEHAHKFNVPVLIDGAQAVSHRNVDVRELDCDFLVLSGHKLFGPTGIGVLYGKEQFLENMPPYQGGGDMIASVTFEKTTYNSLPFKFEAGTPHIAGSVGLGAAIDYLHSLDFSLIEEYENELLNYGTQLLKSIPGVTIIGNAREKTSVMSFVLEGVHPHDIGTILDQEGVAIRTGHHCTQPVMKRFGIPATARASLSFYNTKQELDSLAKGIYKVKEMFGV